MAMVNLLDYPHLAELAWHLKPGTPLEDAEAFALIERGWRHLDLDALDERERALIERLTASAGMESALFRRPHHQRVGQALRTLDAQLMQDAGCYFGGDTGIALRHGEYRESVDMDFMCSDINGFRAVRQRVTAAGFGSLFGDKWALRREARMDQYGIRAALDINGVVIKVEVVLEARIRFDVPGAADRLCGVASLGDEDLVASKLLANSDRWADDSVMSRDLIDLAAMVHDGHLPARALAKATGAYGDSVSRDLRKAVAHTLDREGRLRRCIDAMAVDIPEPVLRARLAALGK